MAMILVLVNNREERKRSSFCIKSCGRINLMKKSMIFSTYSIEFKLINIDLFKHKQEVTAWMF